jgi:large conductance mechanosensitive channel
MSIASEFKQFALRGSVLDLAVGFIIGAAFGRIVTSFTNDLLMPPVGLLLGRVDFSNLFVDISAESYPTLAAAREAGAPVIAYGAFVNSVLDFVIVAAAVFFLVKWFNRVAGPKPAADAPATTKECPYCMSTIAIAATRCAHCTSELRAA